jgi:hypothetical protein
VYYDFAVLPAPLDSLFPNVNRWLSESLERLGRSPFRFLGTAFILKCSKPLPYATKAQEPKAAEPQSVQSLNQHGAVA